MKPWVWCLILLQVCILLSASASFAEQVREVDPIFGEKTEFEFGFNYSHFSKNRLVVNGFSFYDVIIIGRLRVHETRRDIIVPSLTLRHSFSPKKRLELVIPYRYRVENVWKHSDGDQMYVYKHGGIGDVELGMQLELQAKAGIDPCTLLIGVKAPTGLDPYNTPGDLVPLGTGHWGVKLGLVKMKRWDPVVLFAGTNFFWNVARDTDTCGPVDPGDTLQYSLGAAYALNEKFSLNTRFEHSYTGLSTMNGETQMGSAMNAATLYFGANYAPTKDFNFGLSVGVGLTEDAPDFSLKLSIPL